MNNAWNSDEQCVNSDFCLCTVNPCEVTIHTQKKKKKAKCEIGKRNNHLNPNTH